MLQMAFLVMGPEDPQLQWLSHHAVSGHQSWLRHVPVDTIVTARLLPAVVLGGFHFGHGHVDAEVFHWQSMLINELLLLVCCTGFWMHSSRKGRASEVLLHFKFWHRLLHHGLIPAMMLFWIYCITGLTDLQVLHSVWHVVVAVFACTLLRSVLNDESTAASTKVFDPSVLNPNVGHVFLGSVALIL